MSESDTFIKCSECGSDVSPFVTECPYCGNRVRKRAPDVQFGGGAAPVVDLGEQRRKRRKVRPRMTRRPRTSADPFPRPVATLTLVALSVGVSVASQIRDFPDNRIAMIGDLDGEYWQFLTTFFLHGAFGYGFVALLAAAIFGAALEERHGRLVLTVLWLACGAAGAAAEFALSTVPFSIGANGVAVGLLAAWLVGELRRSGPIDRYGVVVIGVLLLALPIATTEASPAAALGGAVAGGLIGKIFVRRA